MAQRSLGVSRADIKPETVEWLWKRRIPKGKVTARDGDPGTGKSLSLYDLGARITSGNPMPDSHHTQRAGALIISAEDGAAGTIVPRFLRAGGASKQARIMGNDRLFVSPDGLDKLERAIRQVGASLVATDPIMSFLSDGVNSNRDQVVRRALQPLVGYAPRRTCAPIVICRHLNKSTGGQSLYRGQGSIRFIGVVRSGLLAGNYPERDGVFVLAGQKHDLSKPPESLAYRIRDAAPGDETAVIEHLGVSAVTAQQMTSTPEDEGDRDKLTEAKEFLRGILSGGPEFTKKIKAEAVEAKIGWRHRKGQRPAQDSSPQGLGKRAVDWTFSGPPKEADDDRPDDVGNLGGLGGLQGDIKVAKEGGDGPTTATTSGNMACTGEDRQGANGCVHTETANEDRQCHQSTNEDRQVANDEVEDLKNLYDQEGGEREPRPPLWSN